MKTMTFFTPHTLTMLVLAACLWLGCGGDEPEPPTATTTAQEQPAPPPADTPVEPASNEATTPDDAMETTTPTPLAMTPADINADKPMPVGDLHAAYFAWKDQSVIVGGYLQSATSRTKINRRISLTDTPGGEARLISCEVTDPSGERVKTDQPVVLKGTYTHFSTATVDGKPQLQLKDCEVISIGETFDEGTEAMPGQAQPIPVQKLYEAITGWQGQEVAVVGYYHSSGYSSAIDKTKINLRSERKGENAVGCQIPGKDVTPENLKDNREGVIMRGTIGEPTWDQVILEDCAFLNR